MARQNDQLLAFNAGEVSRLALARIDVAKLRLAAECQLNWLPWLTGAMMLRPGLGYIGGIVNDAAAVPLPFVKSKLDTALLEVSDGHLRVWVADALVTRAAVSTAVTNGTFSSATGWTLSAGSGTANINSTVAGALYLAAGAGGDSATCLRPVTVAGGDQNVAHALRIVVTRGPVTFRCGSSSGGGEYIAPVALATGTHSLVFTPTGGTVYVQFETVKRYGAVVDSIAVESSGALDLPAPWAAADLRKLLRIDQSGDVIFIACKGYRQRKIERRANNSWSIVTYQADNGPWKTENADPTVTILASATEGSITLTGAKTDFAATDVGSVMRLDEGDLSLIAQWKASETISISTEALPVSGTKIGDMTNLANAFDSNSATAATKTAASGYIGVNEGTASAVYSLRVIGTFDATVTATLTLYGKVGGAPASATDGTALVSVTQSIHRNTAFDITLTASDTNSTWDYIWLGYSLSASAAVSLSEITGLRFTSSGSALLRRYNGNVYQGISGTTTGVNPPVHIAGDVLSETGGTVWRYRHGPFGVARITAVASATSASADVVKTLPDSVTQRVTANWRRSEWNGADGYPTSVCIHEGRLWWFRGDRWYGSESDNYEGYSATDIFGQALGDAAAVIGTFGAGPSDTVSWGVSGLRLLMGREESVEGGRSNSFDQAITPAAFIPKTVSTDGADRLPALKFDQRVVYVQQSHRRVFELAWSPQRNDYAPRDLTRLNLDIGKPGFVSLAAQRQPDPVVYLARGDGQCAVLLYNPLEDTEAWVRLQTLGVIEAVAVLPSDAIEDDVYFFIKRTVNGATKRFIEKLARRDSCVGGQSNLQLDSYVTYSGAAAATITLAHLPSSSVTIWADGSNRGAVTTDGSGVATVPGAAAAKIVAGLAGSMVSNTTDPPNTTLTGTLAVGSAYNGYPAEVYADIGGTGRLKHVGAITVSGGLVTLPESRTALTIVAFLGYVAPFRSAKLAYAAQGGSALAQKKKIDHVGVALLDTHYQGLKYGQDFDRLNDLPLVEEGADTAANQIWPELDSPMSELNGSWDTDARLCLLAQAPNPCTVAGVVIAQTTNG